MANSRQAGSVGDLKGHDLQLILCRQSPIVGQSQASPLLEGIVDGQIELSISSFAESLASDVSLTLQLASEYCRPHYNGIDG